MTQGIPSQQQSSQKNELTRAEQKLRAFHEEEAITKNYDWSLLKKLWPFVKPHRRYIVAAAFGIVVTAGLTLLQPLLMGQVVTHAEQRSLSMLLRDGIWLSVLIVVGQGLSFLQMYTMQLCGALSMADLRRHIFLFFQTLELRFFDKTPVGRLVTRATNDVDALGELFASNVLNSLGDLISLVGIIVMMLVLDFRLALIAFAALPVVGLLVSFVRKRAKRAYREIRTKTARLNSFLSEQVGGIAVVQAFGRESVMQAEFDAINRGYRDANRNSIFYEALLDGAIEFLSTLCMASVLWWSGIRHLSAHPISFALVVTFTQYIRQFFQPVSLLTQRYTILQSALTGAERIFQLLDEKATMNDKFSENGYLSSRKTNVENPHEVIAFEQINFAYKTGIPVLRDITFSVRNGEKIALVGATGAGKTTVTSLLLRLYEAQSGHIWVNGKEIQTYPKSELRKLFSVVPQDVVLFSGTLLSNIALGEELPDPARVEGALEKIDALAWFQKRPLGLLAPVDERGANFSAGERQLIAFARAIYRDAPILILDEATASIDSDTEARLQKALEATLQGRTALVVAHRLSTIKSADRILVFHQGQIVESGRHEELLALGGVYSKLYQLQFAQRKDPT